MQTTQTKNQIAEAENEDDFLELHTTENYIRARESLKRIVALEGGTRSGKTIALAQLFLTLLMEQQEHGTEPFKLSVVRKTLPALKATAMEDFFNLMKELELYDETKHNKTDHIYREGRNVIEFFSVDDQQKVRGRKRTHLWINEANELTFQEFNQLAFRTSKQIFLDFNPVEEDHWLYEKVINLRDDVELIQSSYKDNPFLEPEIVKEIEILQQADENYWRVFGLGLRPIAGTKIYSHYQLVDSFPDNCDEVIYGIDFGFNKPSAIVRIGLKDGACYWDELLYKTGLTNSMLIKEMDLLRKAELLTSFMFGFADAAEPDRIEEINNPTVQDIDGNTIEGFNVRAADKAVKDGIDKVKSMPFFITKNSTNIQEEVKKYLWKTNKDGAVLDEPVKENDHSMDAGRYAVYTYFKGEATGRPNIRLL